MTLEQMAYIAEIVAGIVLAPSLIVLVLQMRQSNRRQQADGIRDAITDFIGAIVQAMGSEEAAANFRQGVRDFDGLSPNGKARFHSTMLKLTGGFDQVFALYNNQLLAEPHFLAAQRDYLTILKSPGAQQWWNSFKHIPPRPLVAHIERAVNDPDLGIQPAHEVLPWLME